MYILGVFGNFYRGSQDPSAVLLKDGAIIAAAEEERFIRNKHAMARMPVESINFCLKKAGIHMDEVDVLVFPQITWNDMRDKLPTLLKTRFGALPKSIEYMEHHLAHAASTFYASGFKEAMILTVDWSGDGVCALIAYGHDGLIEPLKRYSGAEHSLGVYYSLITDYLGFKKDLDEYKVMGLAAYGKPVHDLSWLLDIKNGSIFLDTSYVNRTALAPYPAQHGKQEPTYSERIIQKLGPPRLIGEEVSKKHMDIAASGQKQLEKVMKSVVENLNKQTNCRNLCLAGGVALNSVCNGVLYEMDCVDNIFIPPVASDNGIALGAAFDVAVKNGFKIPRLEHASYGSDFSNDYIVNALERAKCKYERVSNIEKVMAEEIANNKIVGWFQGAMEFGPRALGNRSILADPRRADMRDRINHYVKFREDFRPLAPSVLEEFAEDYFIDACFSPFMTITFRTNEKAKSTIPAVVHVDRTSRIQTVSKAANSRYYSLIEHFREETGVPVVLNTSFNLSWEPIVMNPEQALATFSATGMDSVAIGDYLITKS